MVDAYILVMKKPIELALTINCTRSKATYEIWYMPFGIKCWWVTLADDDGSYDFEFTSLEAAMAHCANEIVKTQF